MKQIIKALVGLVLIFLCAVLLFTDVVDNWIEKKQAEETKKARVHKCSWENCPYQNLCTDICIYTLVGENCEEFGTDSDLITIFHLENPKWTYQECEDNLYEKRQIELNKL